MSREASWDRVEAVLDEALDLPAEEQAAFVERTCGDDEHLRRRVEALLASSSTLDGFLDTPALVQASAALGELTASLTGDAADDLRDRNIGPYRLLELLGHGGMGVVYLAERADEQYEQQVAIKLLPLGLANRLAIGRFRNERQILAQLEHPAIARLLDGGITEDGLPYLAMEYVEGVPIDRYCRERNLSLAERLDLFIEVCGAVDHAHRRLVVHRDLKPANILVTDRGRPKLLDFGIAKLLADAPADLTSTGQRPMTPGYASPEQLAGEPVGTGSDIFSLGVLLYELLAGRHPFREAGDTALEVGRAVAESEPARPSEALHATSRATTDAETRARFERRARPLRGDLDNVVLKALRKETEHRYETAKQLAEDLQNHLRGRPVRARPATWRYRAGKFVGRHTAAVVASCLLLLALLGGLAATAWQARQARRERDEAKLQALRAERTVDFLAGLFRDADPNRTGGRELSARELLEHGASSLDTGLTEEPLVRAELLGAIGTAEGHLGLLERSEEHLREVVAMRRLLHGSDDPDLARALTALGATQLARGDYDGARSSYRESLEICRRGEGPDGLGIAQAFHGLGVVDQKTGNLSAAADAHAEALRIRRTHLEAPHPDLARSLHSLANTRIGPEHREEAIELFEEAIEMWRALGDRHLFELATAENDLGIFLHGLGHGDEAEALYRSSLRTVESLYGADHPNLADHLTNLGKVLIDQGRFREAEPVVRRAVEITHRHREPTHFDRIGAEVNLGSLQVGLGEFGRAVDTYSEAVEKFEELLGPEHPFTGIVLGYLGRARLLAGDETTAAADLERAIDILGASDFATDARAAVPLLAYGCLLRDTRSPREGLPFLERANALLGPGRSWRLAEAQIELGEALRRLGRSGEARELLRAGRETLAATRGTESWLTRRADIYLSRL